MTSLPLVDGKAQYTAMCYEDGGTVDDLLIYKKADQGVFASRKRC